MRPQAPITAPPGNDPLRNARAALADHDYSAALRALRAAPGDALETRTLRTLARNLAALARHRPDLAPRLADAGDPTDLGPYRLLVGPTGHPTLAHGPEPAAKPQPLTPAADPIAQLKRLAPQLKEQNARGGGLALAGLGDGYLLQYLAQQPDSPLGEQRAVFVIEPDYPGLFAALHVIDHTAAAGAIAQPRFQWLVGPDWADALRRRFIDQPTLPPPSSWLPSPPRGRDIAETLQAVAAEGQARRDAAVDRIQTRDRVASRYAPDALAALLGPEPPRPPRALLLTSRFTTVLQYATRDVARGLEALGFETRVAIEPEPWHRLTSASLADAVDRFDPDLVFQIDHLRYELPDWFPRRPPFVGWVQDHLANLDCEPAGRSIGERDFVLMGSPAFYVDRFGYPRRQCLATPKLTHPPAIAGEASLSPDDARPVVAFASNASQTPDRLRDDLLDKYQDAGPFRDLLAAASAAMIDAYARGGHLAGFSGLASVIEGVAGEIGVSIPPGQRVALVHTLAHPLHNALYRQQTLDWLLDAAPAAGLTLELYGAGWESHPRFAPYAKGVADYHAELPELTRTAAVNLQAVPFVSFCHQRLLDGVAAGGFFLVREHPADAAPDALWQWLADHGLEAADGEQAALAATGESHHDELAALIAAVRAAVTDHDDQDAFALVRAWAEAGLLRVGEPPIPSLGEVSFHDPASLAERLKTFAHDGAARRAVVQEQRRDVLERFTYEAGLRGVLDRVRQRLLDEPAARDHDQPPGAISLRGAA